MSKKVVVRYAPSPTGFQHIGGIRTALYNYLFAKQQKGDFILRIEDTDQSRYVEGAEEFIIKAVAWCGFDFTQGVHVGGPHAPYRQSERKETYRKYAEQLVASGNAYYAFDTPEELDEMKEKMKASGIKSPQYNYVTRNSMKNSLTLPEDEVQRRITAGEPYVIRMMVPRKEEVRFHDEVRGWVVIHSSHVDDKVLLKSDGMPTYHLANVVDDHLMAVTHVIRGEEWLPSTPLHVLLYRAFGWEDTMPKFVHLPLLLNPDGSKMSKRSSLKFGLSVYPLTVKDPESGEMYEGYREMGYLPEAFVNYLALLGWNPGNDRELMSMDEMAESFSFDRISKSGAKFDKNKLDHFNQYYLRQKSDEELLPLVKEELEKRGMEGTDDYILKTIGLLKERVTFVYEFAEHGSYFFHAPDAYDEKMLKKWNEESAGHLASLKGKLDELSDWKHDKIEEVFKAYLEAHGLGMGKLLPVLRVALTGMSFGPGVFEIAEMIGKEETMKRIEDALERIPLKQ